MNCRTISSFVVPWTLNCGWKNADQAVDYVKKMKIKQHNEEEIEKYMKGLTTGGNAEILLSEIIGEQCFKPSRTITSYFNIDVNEELKIVAFPEALTANNETVVMVDTFATAEHLKRRRQTVDEMEIKLLATMAVCRARKGIYLLMNVKGKIEMEFDEERWMLILDGVKNWAACIEFT